MKKKYNLLSKEKIDKNLRICNNLKLFIIFLTTALLTWIIIDFAQDLKEINKSIIKNEPNNEYVILIIEGIVQKRM